MPIQQDTSNLSLINYKFKLSATPNVEYRVQRADLPGISLGTATINTPFVPMKLSGNITYDDLQVSFLVGENMRDYMEVYDWITRLGYPDNLSQYRGDKYEASLMILNSALTPIRGFSFSNVLPSQLSGISFDTTLQDVQYAECTLTLQFTSMSTVDLS